MAFQPPRHPSGQAGGYVPPGGQRLNSQISMPQLQAVPQHSWQYSMAAPQAMPLTSTPYQPMGVQLAASPVPGPTTSFHAPSVVQPYPRASNSSPSIATFGDALATVDQNAAASASSATQPPPHKKRIAQSACETCRRKRTRCVVEADSQNGECNNCRALGVECLFSGVDKRKESVKDLRARVAYLEQLFENVRSASTESALRAVLEEVRSDAALEGRLRVETSRDRAGSNMNGAYKNGTATSPGFKKRRFKYDETETEVKSDGSEIDRSSYRTRPNGQTPSASKIESDLSDSSPTVDDDFVTAQLTEMVDRLTVGNDGQIRAVGATSNAVFSGSIASSASPGSSPTNSGNLNNATHNAFQLDAAGAMSRQAITPANSSLRYVDVATAVAALDYKAAHLPTSIPRSLVESLLNTYFIWYQCAFPVVSRPDLLRCMVDGGEYFRPCLFNAILAFASQWSDDPLVRTDPSDPHTAGDMFFNTAKELLDGDFEQPTVNTVQALTIMASREHGCGRDSRGWVYNGIASRLALDMGLHLDHTPLVQREILTKRDAFLRSMIFWTVWYFDKEYCALIGRPSTLKDIVITCPKYTDMAKSLQCEELLREQDIDWFASQSANEVQPLPEEAPSASTSVTTPRGVMHLAPQSVELAGLFEDAMGQIYYRGKEKLKGGSNNARLASGLRERLSNLEKTMTSINEYMQSNVPASPTETASVDPATGRLISPQPIQPFVLQLHYIYNAAIIIYNRPFLSRQCAYSRRADHTPGQCLGGCRAPTDPMNPRTICYQAAEEILDLVALWQASNPRGLATANNTQQHALFTAATVLIIEAGGAGQAKLSTLDQERRLSARQLLHDRVLPMFEAMAVRRPAAKRSLDSMRELLLNREIEEQQKAALKQAQAALQPVTADRAGAGEQDKAPSELHYSSSLPKRPESQALDSGVPVSDAHLISGRVKVEEEVGQITWQQAAPAAGSRASLTPRAFTHTDLNQPGPVFSPPTQQWFDSASSTFPSYFRYAYSDAMDEILSSPAFYDGAATTGQFATGPSQVYPYVSHQQQQQHQPQSTSYGDFTSAEGLLGGHEAYRDEQGSLYPASMPQQYAASQMTEHGFTAPDQSRAIFPSSGYSQSSSFPPKHAAISVSPQPQQYNQNYHHQQQQQQQQQQEQQQQQQQQQQPHLHANHSPSHAQYPQFQQ